MKEQQSLLNTNVVWGTENAYLYKVYKKTYNVSLIAFIVTLYRCKRFFKMKVQGFVSTFHQTWHHSDSRLFILVRTFYFLLYPRYAGSVSGNFYFSFFSGGGDGVEKVCLWWKLVPKLDFPRKLCWGMIFTLTKLYFFPRRQLISSLHPLFSLCWFRVYLFIDNLVNMFLRTE